MKAVITVGNRHGGREYSAGMMWIKLPSLLPRFCGDVASHEFTAAINSARRGVDHRRIRQAGEDPVLGYMSGTRAMW
jgi:hypothetical protein